jgi:hypothetical protein
MMNKRIATILSFGAVILLPSYIILNYALPWWLMPHESEARDYPIATLSTERANGLAPVQLWYEAPPGQKSDWRAKRSARFLLLLGQAYIGDVLLPREKIKAYLDAKVQSGEIDYVVVFPSQETKWNEIFPVIDECRKSRVRIVLLNQNGP